MSASPATPSNIRPEYSRIYPLPEQFSFAYVADLPGALGIIAVPDDEDRDKGGHFIVIDTQLPRGIYSGYLPEQEQDSWGTWNLSGLSFVYGDGGGHASVLGLARPEEGGNTVGGYRHGLVYGYRIGSKFGKAK